MAASGNIAVFDLGKTHAKVILFDPERLEEIAVLQLKNTVLLGPPYPHFDIPALKAFVTSSLKQLAAEHEIASVFVSTHGAAAAVIAEGELALPVLDYEFGGPDEFAAEYDAVRPLFERTGTPRMGGGLNLGAQLYWLARRFPEEMGRADTLLFWPQYWAHWFSGMAASEVAYAGCHTDLWDLTDGAFLPLSRYGVPGGLGYPPMRWCSDVLGPVRAEIAEATGLDAATEVYCGGHDSSLSLVSVGREYPGPCTVLSTGTWVTIFALGLEEPDVVEEPGLTVSMDCEGRVTPSYRFPGGAIYADLLGQMQGRDAPDAVEELRLEGFDTAATARVVAQDTGEPVDLSGWDRDAGAEVVSRLLGRQALHGLRAIGARGPIVLSGPFSGNAVFREMLGSAWEAEIHVEENLLGICKGIAASVSGAVPQWDRL
ncbi:MAG: carbohydrate kinase [Pseudomonadota bacterium]